MAEFKRWYDHDPLLMELIELLRCHQDLLKEQATVFLNQIEQMAGKDSVEKFYNIVKPEKANRWYDKDPVLSRAIELLRIVPPDIQRKAAESFLNSLKDMGLSVEAISQTD